MARPLRIQLPGLTYHIHARGNGRMTIYRDDRDREKFLELLAEVVQLFRLACAAFCLMRNHYHLVVTTADANLSKAMHALNGRYGQWWNRRHQHVGHVFQGRFGAKVVQQDVYLLTVCKYVVENPVRKKLVDSPAEWRWSSYRASAGIDPVPSFLRPGLLWQVLGDGDLAARTSRYRAFIATPSDDAETMKRPIIGDPEFAKRFEGFRRRASREVPRREREGRPELDALFQGVVRRSERNAQAFRAHAGGHPIASIARYLGLHPSTVSKMIAGVDRGSGVKKPIISDLTPQA